MKEDLRVKRQAGASGVNVTYYVTRCGYDNEVQPTDEPSIPVMGVKVKNGESVRKAARLIHLMTRFMPRPLFRKLAEMNSSVGIFSLSGLPDAFLPPDLQTCQSSCQNIYLPDGQQIDCTSTCTNTHYPHAGPNTPIIFLWAYGNLTTTYVVETNIMCGTGFNPGGSENLLVREFGLHVMLRAMDPETRAALDEAYTEAASARLYQQLSNVYDYFMKATQAWFNAAMQSLGGMACQYTMDPNTFLPLCTSPYEQRQYLKTIDPKLYQILSKVYDNSREYVETGTSLCVW